MKMGNRTAFLERSSDVLVQWMDLMDQSPVLQMDELDPAHAALVIVDLVNGFAREGALQSPRVDALAPLASRLLTSCKTREIPCLAFADSHGAGSPEFESYPPHCLAGTSESELLDELKTVGGYTLIPKNSVNGFLEPAFQQWLEAHPETDVFVVIGDCTDICITQFATTLKAWFNRTDRPSRILVPENAVDTYDFGLHDGDLTHLAALYGMSINGIEIVRVDA